ncbi:MAG: hypothetical protein U0Q22_07415 [Acidimicrobiales bacterium]
MIPRQSPLAPSAILFADGGASGHGGHDTVDSFLLARRLGATGIASDLAVTSDGVAVLRRDPKVGGLRKRRLSDVAHADLPDDVVALSRFYEAVGGDLPLLLRVRAHGAVRAAVEDVVSLAARHQALERLWLCSDDPSALAEWRERSSVVRLVDTTPIAAMSLGPERHAADLRSAGVDAVLLPRSDWSGGRTALFHRFGRWCFAADAPHERMIASLLHIGVDGVLSPYPDRLVDAAAAHAAPDAPAFRED